MFCRPALKWHLKCYIVADHDKAAEAPQAGGTFADPVPGGVYLALPVAINATTACAPHGHRKLSRSPCEHDLCNTGSRDVLQTSPRAGVVPAAVGALQAEPPAPSAPPATADMAFIMSAPSAALTPDKLTLTGVSSTAQFLTDDKKTGSSRMGAPLLGCMPEMYELHTRLPQVDFKTCPHASAQYKSHGQALLLLHARHMHVMHGLQPWLSQIRPGCACTPYV